MRWLVVVELHMLKTTQSVQKEEESVIWLLLVEMVIQKKSKILGFFQIQTLNDDDDDDDDHDDDGDWMEYHRRLLFGWV